MMKRTVFFLALMAIWQSVFAYDFSAVAPSGQTLYYNIVNGEAQVTYHSLATGPNASAYSNLVGTLTIPGSVTYGGFTYAVTSIGHYAFWGCVGLTSVTIPNTVTSIEDQAFYRCSGLTSVTIPNMVTDIEFGTFYGCSGLTSVTIPNSVTSIDGFAFYGCSGLTSVTIPNSVTHIGYDAFEGCSGLTSVTIPNSVTTIGQFAFNGCSGLTSPVYNNTCFAYLPAAYAGSYAIPSGITTICGGAFYGCSGLTSVTIPNSVTNIGYRAFEGCSGLTSVTIPNTVDTIGGYAFNGCSGLTSPVYNNTCFAYLPAAYAGSYTIPSGITTICGGAFDSCSGLTSVTIPNSVTSIGNGAFYYCSGLTSVTIPNSVTSIGNGAFYYCSGLTSVTIPNSVTSIGGYAFYGCIALRTVNMLSPDPPVLGNDVFIGTHSSLVIMLNGCGYDAYCNSWNAYCNRLVEPIPEIDIHTESHDTDRGGASVLPLRGHEVRCDSTAVVTATPNYGYHFSHWSNGSTANPDTLHLTGDSTVTAYFERNTYTVSTFSNDDALGYACGDVEGLYLDTIELSATCTAEHYHFSRWSDGNTDNPRRYVVEGNRTLTALFAIDTHTVRVTCDVARGTVSGGGRFTYGSACTVEAQEPYTGFVFHSWSNGVTANPYVFAVISDIELSAIFVAEGEEVYTVTVASADPEMGFVGGGGQALAGGRLTIRAQGYPGYRFLRWNDNNTDSVRTVTVTADRTYTAHFAQLVGIEDVDGYDQSGPRLYPNPAHSSVTVTGLEPGRRIALVDLYGRTLADLRATSTELTIDVSALSPGTYFVRVEGLPAQKVVVIN